MKKILGLLLTMSILLYIIPQAAFAADASGTVYSAAEAELAITRAGGTVTAAYSGADASSGYRIILAAYDAAGAARDVIMRPLSQSKTVSLPAENGKYYKAFALDPQTMKPLCDSVLDGDVYSGTVEVPLIDGAEAEAVTAAVRRYGDARLMVEKLAESDITAVEGDSKKLSEYIAMLNDAIAAYDDVMQAAAVLDAVSDKSIELETASLTEETEQAFSVQATKDEQLHWAEEFTKKYDSIRGANKLKALAEMMGCDAAEAYAQLVASQNILHGAYKDKADVMDKWVKGLTVVKTGAKVGLVVGATIATAGAGGATITGATGLWLGTADAVVDVGKTTATIVYGDESKTVKDIDNFFKPVTTASMVFSIITFDAASTGEKLAILYDTKEALDSELKNRTGYSLDDFTNFQYRDEKLYAELRSKVLTDKQLKNLLLDPAMIGHEGSKELIKGKDRLEEEREEITDEKIERILKDGDVLNENETLDDFKDEQTEFEKKVKTKKANKDEEENDEEETPSPSLKPTHAPEPTPTPRVTYHEEYIYGHLIKYYYDNEINHYVGVYEDYNYNRTLGEWVLVDLTRYSDDGLLLSRTGYKGDNSGRISSHYTYTDGENLGSIWTRTIYYGEQDDVQLPAGVTNQIKDIEQYICVPYVDENGQPILDENDEEQTTWKSYYGDYYHYDENGNLAEHSSGIEGQWAKTEGFDGSGTLSYDYINNFDGTYTYNSYYTNKPKDCLFDPTGHKQVRDVHTIGQSYWADGIPNYGEKLISSEEWSVMRTGYDHYMGYAPGDPDGEGRGRYQSTHTGRYYSECEFIKIVDLPD